VTRVRTDRLWDMSQPVCHDGPAWVEHEPPTIRRNYRREAEGVNVETVRLTTHTGTHVDAPFHFDDDGATIDQMPLAAFMGPAALIDLREVVQPAQPIGREQLEGAVELLREGDFAILVTGWGARRGINAEFLKRWPYLGGDGAELLLERGAHGVGIDALSLGGFGGLERGEPCHAVLLGAGRAIIEDMRIPEELIGSRVFLSAFPVLLEGCGGAWARAVAWELDEEGD
jgi:arylformamidase